jgi:hypothetical protein
MEFSMKKTVLVGVAMTMMLPLFASADDLNERIVDVVSGTCVSADKKFTAEISGFVVIDESRPTEDNIVNQFFKVKLKQTNPGNYSVLMAVDGKSKDLAYTISDDGTRVNVNAVIDTGSVVEADLTCDSEVNKKAMASFIKLSL